MGTPVLDPSIAVSILDTSSQYDSMVAGAVDDIISINAIDTIDLGNLDLSGVTITGGGVGTGMYSNTIPNNYTYGNVLLDNPFTVGQTNTSNTINLQGNNADIKINGESVMETLRWMKERLAWLDVRSDLESEWQELRELGDQYRALVANIEDKVRMWDTLKKMPPPVMP